MPPSNPSTELFTLGKGTVWIAEWSGGTPGAYRDVGNAPEFNLELTTEELNHFSSRSGARSKDKVVVIERGYRVNFGLDEIGDDNLKMFVMGSISGGRIHGLTDTSKEFAVKFKADNPEGPNRIYEFWRCKVKPNGAASLIGDDWMKLPYIGEGLEDLVNHSSSPFFDIYSTTTTTTTSSTTTTTAP